MAIDYVNSLGAGAGIDTKALVSSLVEAERAGKKALLDNKISDNNAQISALGTAVTKVTDLRLAAIALNDASDFNNFSISNTQTSALSVSANGLASAGSHTITVTSQAKAQSSNTSDASTSSPVVGFTSGSQNINGGNTFDMVFTLGTNSQTTQTVSVSSATPDGVVTAINEANMGITAQLVALDTSGSNYSIQLIGQTGVEGAYSISESVSELNFTTPSGFSAADADLTVNGVQYARATNTIDDIVTGVTLSLAGATSGAATIGINEDTTAARANIESFVSTYNLVQDELIALTSSASDGALASDSIAKQVKNDLRSIVLNASTTPGSNISRLSDMGIEVTKTGDLEIIDATLTSALSNNFSDVIKVFSADTNNDSEIGVASRGIAGDLSKYIKDITSRDGYFTTQATKLSSRVDSYQLELTELEERMASLEERYTKQFLSMQTIVEQMNSTKDSLKSSFEALPFNNRND